MKPVNVSVKHQHRYASIHIPTEILGVIFSYLEHVDTAKLSRVNKAWRYAYRNTSTLRHLNIWNNMMCYLSLTHRHTLNSMYVTGVTQPELRICRYPRKTIFSHSVLHVFPLIPQPSVEELTLHETSCERIDWKHLPNLKILFVIGSRGYTGYHPPNIDITRLTSVNVNQLRNGSFDLSYIFTNPEYVDIDMLGVDINGEDIFDIEDTDLYNMHV